MDTTPQLNDSNIASQLPLHGGTDEPCSDNARNPIRVTIKGESQIAANLTVGSISSSISTQQLQTETPSFENLVNAHRDEELKGKITDEFLVSLRKEEIEFGVASRTEIIVERQLKLNAMATRNWLNDLFVTHFNDTKILGGILHIISRFDELEMHPQGQTMALAAFNHSSDEIKELGVRAFEHWGSKNSLRILQDVSVETKWLQDYINQVVEDLSIEHGLSGQKVH